MHFDPTQFIGLTGVPFIEQVVQYLKNEMRMPTYLAPLAALIVGIGLNVGLANYLMQPLLPAIYLGLFTGFMTSFWHEIAKKPNTPAQ